MKEQVKDKKVKGEDTTIMNHGKDKMQISTMEDKCNANVDNVVECSIISQINGLGCHNRTRHNQDKEES